MCVWAPPSYVGILPRLNPVVASVDLLETTIEHLANGRAGLAPTGLAEAAALGLRLLALKVKNSCYPPSA